MAYVLGFFAADGYITINKRGGHFWCINISDKKLLMEIRNKIESNHKIGIRHDKKGKYTTYRLQIGSIGMCDDLRKLGFQPNKTKSLAIPNIPDKHLSHFTRGYFDGDGHVWSGKINKERKTPHIIIQSVFTSCSNEFLNKLKERLLYFGINKGRISKGKGNYYRLVYSVTNSLKLYNFMYNDLALRSLYLDRKKKVFERYIKMRPWCSLV